MKSRLSVKVMETAKVHSRLDIQRPTDGLSHTVFFGDNSTLFVYNALYITLK